MTPAPQSPDGSSRFAELVHQGWLAWRLVRDGRVPAWQKAIPILALLYVVSPLDLVPDLVLPFGAVDDLAVVLVALRVFVRLAPSEVVADIEGRTDERTIDAPYRVRDDA